MKGWLEILKIWNTEIESMLVVYNAK